MGAREEYFIQSFPMFIDPVSESLEVQLALYRVESDGKVGQLIDKKWTQMHRVQVRHDTFPFSPSADMIHFFGMAPRVEDCQLLMVYDATGVFRYRIDKYDGEFVPRVVPEEVNGQSVVKPSIRITFDRLKDAQKYLTIVEVLREGGKLRPEVFKIMRRVIRRSAEVHFISVAKKS